MPEYLRSAHSVESFRAQLAQEIDTVALTSRIEMTAYPLYHISLMGDFSQKRFRFRSSHGQGREGMKGYENCFLFFQATKLNPPAMALSHIELVECEWQLSDSCSILMQAAKRGSEWVPLMNSL